jgi:hypothetical protein
MNPVIDIDGTKRWYNDNNELHREDGPAAELKSGTKYWCINGKFHRTDGPAFEKSNGEKGWYLNGTKIHCKDNEEFLRIIKLKSLL